MLCHHHPWPWRWVGFALSLQVVARAIAMTAADVETDQSVKDVERGKQSVSLEMGMDLIECRVAGGLRGPIMRKQLLLKAVGVEVESLGHWEENPAVKRDDRLGLELREIDMASCLEIFSSLAMLHNDQSGHGCVYVVLALVFGSMIESSPPPLPPSPLPPPRSHSPHRVHLLLRSLLYFCPSSLHDFASLKCSISLFLPLLLHWEVAAASIVSRPCSWDRSRRV